MSGFGFDSDDTPVNPRRDAQTFSDVLKARLARRTVLQGGVAAMAAAGTAGCATGAPARGAGIFSFEEIERGTSGTHVVAPGHEAVALLRWGDPIFADAPAFAPSAQSAAAQARQFGYNNDYVAYLPLPKGPSGRRGLLCVNHEYTNAAHMFPGLGAAAAPARKTAEQCAVEMAAHGVSIVEIEEVDGAWRPAIGSRFNRRITAETPMVFSGPAAGAPRLATSYDREGRAPLGTLNNCAGGVTPWGTYLTAEENVNYYFGGALPADHPEAGNHKRMGLPNDAYGWGAHAARFDIGKEPNEPNRFGWIVEIDPRNPEAPPIKRTALGRFKHEGAETVIAPDGRLVVYMGDDQRFEYVYKFVSRRRVDRRNPAANRDLLDDGTLYVARFEADGTLVWRALTFGEGPLTPENGFASQADVLIEARRAGDLLGATPMDRPEDVQPDARAGRAYVMLTNNTQRKADQTNAANPRAENRFGHIVEILEPEGDFAATQSRWEMLVRCGDPAEPTIGAQWSPAISRNGWFAAPDNGAIDPAGRLWVTTDGNDASGAADDGVWALETDGPNRGLGRAFFRAPVGAEVCGPAFTPEGDVMFIPVQHPGEVDGASFEAPATRWPDFDPALPPRSAIVAVRRSGGGIVG